MSEPVCVAARGRGGVDPPKRAADVGLGVTAVRSLVRTTGASATKVAALQRRP